MHFNPESKGEVAARKALMLDIFAIIVVSLFGLMIADAIVKVGSAIAPVALAKIHPVLTALPGLVHQIPTVVATLPLSLTHMLSLLPF